MIIHGTYLPEAQRNPKELENGRAGCARFLAQLEEIGAVLVIEWYVFERYRYDVHCRPQLTSCFNILREC